MTEQELAERIVIRYQRDRLEGRHDARCEYRVEGFYMCHCSKRRREAEGFTEPPGEELYFPPPACPRCDRDLDHDDGWRCHRCRLAWSAAGTDAWFTDDYGDVADYLTKWEDGRRRRGRTATPDEQLPEGGTRITVKRACNGCGRTLGDATTIELACAVLGYPLPDVRYECGCTDQETTR